MLNKKDYNKLVHIISINTIQLPISGDKVIDYEGFVDDIINWLKEDNKNFNIDKFKTALNIV